MSKEEIEGTSNRLEVEDRGKGTEDANQDHGDQVALVS